MKTARPEINTDSHINQLQLDLLQSFEFDLHLNFDLCHCYFSLNPSEVFLNVSHIKYAGFESVTS